MFVAALFAMDKTCKQPKCPSTDEWTKKKWSIYTVEYYLDIKKSDNAICSNIDGLGWHYAKWNKPHGERQMLHDITKVCNLKSKWASE